MCQRKIHCMEFDSDGQRQPCVGCEANLAGRAEKGTDSLGARGGILTSWKHACEYGIDIGGKTNEPNRRCHNLVL